MMFTPNVAPPILQIVLLTIFTVVAVVVLCPTSTNADITSGERKELHNKFTAVLKKFLVAEHGGEQSSEDSKTMKFSYSDAARMMRKFWKMSNYVFNQCSHYHAHFMPTEGIDISLRNPRYTAAIVSALGDDFKTLLRPRPEIESLEDKAKRVDESHYHLAWLLTFAARLGYTVGMKAFYQENKEDSIKLENSIIAIGCLGLASSAHYMPTTTTFIADDEHKTLSINFDVEIDPNSRANIEYNFESLSYLLDSEKQTIFQLKNQIWSIEQTHYGDTYRLQQEAHDIHKKNKNNPLNRLMMTWTGRTDTLNSWKAASHTFDDHVLYLLTRFGHGLAQRMLDATEQLGWYMRMFPDTKNELTHLAATLKKRIRIHQKDFNHVFAENTQALMHYEDAIEIESDFKSYFGRLIKVTTKWHEKLHQSKNLNDFCLAIEEIRKDEVYEEMFYLSPPQEECVGGGVFNSWKKFKNALSKLKAQVCAASSVQRVHRLKNKIQAFFHGKSADPNAVQLLSDLEEFKEELKKEWKKQLEAEAQEELKKKQLEAEALEELKKKQLEAEALEELKKKQLEAADVATQEAEVATQEAEVASQGEVVASQGEVVASQREVVATQEAEVASPDETMVASSSKSDN